MQQRHGCDHCEDQPAFPRTILLIIAGIESYCNRPRASITSPSAVPVASVARNPGSSCSSAWDTRTARTFAPPPPLSTYLTDYYGTLCGAPETRSWSRGRPSRSIRYQDDSQNSAYGPQNASASKLQTSALS